MSQAMSEIKRGLLFAGLMLAVAFGAKLAFRAGLIADPEMSRRASMVILGAFYVAMGNAMPKTLVPLSVQQCDSGRAQAFQRFAGWTFVLSGLAYAVCWLVLPVPLAQPVSVAFLLGGTALVAVRAIRLKFSHRKSA